MSCLQRCWNTKSSEQLWWECLHPFVPLPTNLWVTTELTQLPFLISPEVRKTASGAEQALKWWRNWKTEPTAGFTWQQMDSEALGSLCYLKAPHAAILGHKNHEWEPRNMFHIRLSITASQCCVLVSEEHQTRHTNTSPKIYRDTLLCRGMRQTPSTSVLSGGWRDLGRPFPSGGKEKLWRWIFYLQELKVSFPEKWAFKEPERVSISNSQKKGYWKLSWFGFFSCFAYAAH